MKINVKGLIFVGVAAAVFANAAQATGEEKIVTSKKYVDAKISNNALADNVTDKAPSVDVVYDAIADLQGDIQEISTNAVQADWTQQTDSAPDYIKHKPGNFTAPDTTNHTNGTSGFVPAPLEAEDGYVLSTDGWVDPQDSNVIEEVQVNGTALTPDNNKAVNVVVPILGVQAAGSDLTPDANKKVNVPVMTAADGSAQAVAPGLVPGSGNDVQANTKFLRGDGTWVAIDGVTAYTGAGDTNVTGHVITTNVPVKGITANNVTQNPDTNGIVDIPVMTGADATNQTAGVAGLVPTSNAADQDKVLTAGATWAINHDTTVATGSTNGTISVTRDGTPASVSVYGLDNAAYKDVDTAIGSQNLTSVKLPTTAAVVNYVTTLNNGLALPAAASGTCGTGAPCALVLENGTVSWETIQQ